MDRAQQVPTTGESILVWFYSTPRSATIPNPCRGLRGRILGLSCFDKGRAAHRVSASCCLLLAPRVSALLAPAKRISPNSERVVLLSPVRTITTKTQPAVEPSGAAESPGGPPGEYRMSSDEDFEIEDENFVPTPVVVSISNT